MLLFVTAAKLLAEIALMSLLGRWVLQAWLHRLRPTGGGPNVFVWVLDTLCRPWLTAAGWISPRWVLRQHRALVAFLVLLLLWAAVTVAKIVLCLDLGVQTCR